LFLFDQEANVGSAVWSSKYWQGKNLGGYRDGKDDRQRVIHRRGDLLIIQAVRITGKPERTGSLMTIMNEKSA